MTNSVGASLPGAALLQRFIDWGSNTVTSAEYERKYGRDDSLEDLLVLARAALEAGPSPLRHLAAELEALRQKHRVVEDCWYSCPLALQDDGTSECCDESELESPKCRCGASAFNEKLDVIIAEVRGESVPPLLGPWYVDGSIKGPEYWYVGNGKRGHHFVSELEARTVCDALNRAYVSGNAGDFGVWGPPQEKPR